MRWDMEIEEIEAVLEKIWDLHDKLSDAIHSISRSHFLTSIKSLRPSSDNKKKLYPSAADDDPASAAAAATGFVFVKDFRSIDEAEFSAIQEAKSLNAIRTALENLEDQLEFFHTVQMQQRAERDAAIARLEQSRIVLAIRLDEHHGKKFKVIEEARAFVGEVNAASRFVSPENLYGGGGGHSNPSGESLTTRGGNFLLRILVSGFDFANKSLKLDNVGGMLGNAALFAVSMMALLHLHHQVAYKEQHQYKQEDGLFRNGNVKRGGTLEGSPSGGGGLNQLDVMLARG
ncbi:hypothetical protein Tsubulata_046310 [Turnera subulata]|uniref:Plastid division protein PDV1 n=1 Tax=Turnera subulata TaxID=218843 RepID=A0A9Q0G796_9ROSI|nr:hypothetical protein Tsubulata_046310 [Turnera subulata]